MKEWKKKLVSIFENKKYYFNIKYFVNWIEKNKKVWLNLKVWLEKYQNQYEIEFIKIKELVINDDLIFQCYEDVLNKKNIEKWLCDEDCNLPKTINDNWIIFNYIFNNIIIEEINAIFSNSIKHIERHIENIKYHLTNLVDVNFNFEKDINNNWLVNLIIDYNFEDLSWNKDINSNKIKIYDVDWLKIKIDKNEFLNKINKLFNKIELNKFSLLEE